MSLGTLFTIFGAMGAGLKFHGFSGLSGGSPELRQRTSGKVTSLFQRAELPGGIAELRQRTSGRVTGLFQGAEKQHSYRYHPSVLRLKSTRR